MKTRKSSWAVGLTTTRRTRSTIKYTLNNLANNGFQPTIFAEPNSYIPEDYKHYNIVQRETKYGAFKNWYEGIKELRRSNPNASFYAMFQDDLILCKNVKDYIENTVWPEGAGVLSGYTPVHYKGERGWNWVNKGEHLWGAVALFFKGDAIDSIIEHPTIKDWDGHRNIDSRLGLWAQETGFKTFYHTPSLSQHIGDESTVCDAPATGMRAAGDFMGEEFDIMQLFGVYTTSEALNS
jgi:hypothetical protein